MSVLSTEFFPYSSAYVQELLAIDEYRLMQLVAQLHLTPQRDMKTGRLVFTHAELELLKQAGGLAEEPQPLTDSAPQVSAEMPYMLTSPVVQKTFIEETHPAQPSVYAHEPKTYSTPPASAPVPVQTPASMPAQPPSSSGSPIRITKSAPAVMQARDTNLSAMIETVTQVKETILKDMSRMLDDKLAGLDEVVVELIRAKSETDSLKSRLEELQRRNAELEAELASFKPFQFGLYRKEKEK